MNVPCWEPHHPSEEESSPIVTQILYEELEGGDIHTKHIYTCTPCTLDYLHRATVIRLRMVPWRRTAGRA